MASCCDYFEIRNQESMNDMSLLLSYCRILAYKQWPMLIVSSDTEHGNLQEEASRWSDAKAQPKHLEYFAQTHRTSSQLETDHVEYVNDPTC